MKPSSSPYTRFMSASLLLALGCGPSAPTPTSEAEQPEPAASEQTPALSPVVAPIGEPPASSGIGSRVYVVERDSNQLAVYDFLTRELLPGRVGGLGDMHHATMTFSPNLRYGFVASRNGVLNRVDLTTMQPAGALQTSENSIDLAISQDGRYIAVAEYIPGGVSIIDQERFEVVERIPANYEGVRGPTDSRVTGMVDTLGNRFVCSLIEGKEVWIIDASGQHAEDEPASFPIERRIALAPESGMPYDAMITPDGRYYVVAHLGEPNVSVIDLAQDEPSARLISLLDPAQKYDVDTPVKLPHMASWAVAGERIFVPLVGESRLAVLDRHSFAFSDSVPLRGHPVYAVRSPSEREIWVSFSGEDDDAYVQVVDTESLAVVDTIEIGARIYHMDFTPRGAYVLVSANKANKLVLVNAGTHQIEDEQTLNSPSGIFGVWRAFRPGL